MQLGELEKDYYGFKRYMVERHDRLREELLLLRDIVWGLVRSVEDMRKEFQAEMKERDERFEREMQKMREEFQAEMRERDERFEREMQKMREEFRSEMRERDERFEREMQRMREEFQAEMQRMREEFQAEMRERDERFEREMGEMREEFRRWKQEMNKRWGEMAQRLGTITEDVFAPGIPYLVKNLGYRVRERMLDVEYERGGYSRQYDALVVAEDEEGREVVFVAEVKSQARSEDFKQLKGLVEDLLGFKPEYGERRVVPVLAAFRVPGDLVNLANKRGVLLVRMGGEYLEALNPEVLNPSS